MPTDAGPVLSAQDCSGSNYQGCQDHQSDASGLKRGLGELVCRHNGEANDDFGIRKRCSAVRLRIYVYLLLDPPAPLAATIFVHHWGTVL
jgi:hypothetical protein